MPNVVDQHPRRGLQHDARQGETNARPGSTPGPSAGSHRACDTSRSRPSRRSACAKAPGSKRVDLQRIGQDLPQRASRQIGSAARQIEDRLVLRADVILPRAPGPQTRQRAEQQRLARSGRTDDQDALARLHDYLLFLEQIAARRRDDLEVVDCNRARLPFGVGDAAIELAQTRSV